MKKPKNYLSNKALYEAMKVHRQQLTESNEKGVDKPRISNYIGECITLICNNLSKRPNFVAYSYKDDMVFDGIIDCIAAVDNFDPEKTTQPFSYFTQIAWNAFIRRIHKEKRQNYIKHKNFENSFLMDELWENSDGMQLTTNEYSSEIVKSFEETIKKKAIKDLEKKGLNKT